MQSVHLREHDANQGAQSSGEFLGMTGNSGWLLLGSSGATILMVIFLWGVFGVSLLLCLFAGLVLCALSVAYVFALKNNKPEHYDTDFFESAMVEAGLREFHFGPRRRSPNNPFTGSLAAADADVAPSRAARPRKAAASGRSRCEGELSPARVTTSTPLSAQSQKSGTKDEVMIPQTALERLQEQLTTTEEMLDEALAESAET